MRKISFIFGLLLSLVLLSCNNSNEENSKSEDTQLVRKGLIQKNLTGKTGDFNSLSTEEKVGVWENKITQVLSQQLTPQQRSLTEAILIEIPKLNTTNYDGIKIVELGIAMAEITPQDEFIRMFENLDNYERNEKLYIGSFNNNYILTDMKDFLQEVKENNKKFYQYTERKRPCNCKWTCGFYAGSTDNCEATDSGCGFLNIQHCTGVIN